MGNRNLLVVEGADCMGKTTLVGQLQEALKWPTLHTGGPKTDEQLEESMRRVEAISSSYIIDRLPVLSEICYRPITRGVVVPEDLQLQFLDRVSELDPVVVVCRTQIIPNIVAEERPHKSLEYWAKVKEGYPGIVARYDTLVDWLRHARVNVFVYDWTDPQAFGALKGYLNFYLRFDEVL